MDNLITFLSSKVFDWLRLRLCPEAAKRSVNRLGVSFFLPLTPDKSPKSMVKAKGSGFLTLAASHSAPSAAASTWRMANAEPTDECPPLTSRPSVASLTGLEAAAAAALGCLADELFFADCGLSTLDVLLSESLLKSCSPT